MIKLTILYPRKEGSRFDFDYYLKTHMPMSIERLGPALREVAVERGLHGVPPETPPANVAICHMYFDSMEAFMESFMPHMEALQGDMINYTDIAPVIQFSEVKLHQGWDDYPA